MWVWVGSSWSQRSLFSLRLWIQVTWSCIECSFGYNLFFWGNRKLLLFRSQYKSDFKKRSIHMYFIGSILCNRTNTLLICESQKSWDAKGKLKTKLFDFFSYTTRNKSNFVSTSIAISDNSLYQGKKWVRFKYPAVYKNIWNDKTASVCVLFERGGFRWPGRLLWIKSFFFHGIATGRRQEAGRFMLCLRGRAHCSSEVGLESLY